MIRSHETRPSLTITVVENELITAEILLRNSLTSVAKVNSSFDGIYNRNCVTSLITKKNYEVATCALISRKEQTSHVRAAEQLAESRLDIVHRNSYEAVKLLNSR